MEDTSDKNPERTNGGDVAVLDGTRRKPVDIARFDLSSLVGHKLTLFSEQLSNRPLTTRILAANDSNSIAIDRGGGDGLIDSLVNNQRVTVQMSYKGERIAIRGTLKRSGGGAGWIEFDDTVLPLFRRRYPRLNLVRRVRLAAVPLQTFSRSRMSRLRWLETKTINLSGGGTMIELSSHLESPTYLFLSIVFPDVSFPSLLMGQVRHSHQVDTGRYQAGIEFICREQRHRHFAPSIAAQLPPAVLVYDDVQRHLLSKRLLAWVEKNQQ